MSEEIIWDDLIVADSHGSFVMRRNTALRITDLEGDGNLVTLFHSRDRIFGRNRTAPLPKYSVLKAQTV